MSPLEPGNCTIVGSEKWNITDAQEKDFKTAIMNMFKDLKQDMNESLMKSSE